MTFDEQLSSQQKVTPTLAEVLKTAMLNFSLDLRCCMPATIVKYDYKKQVVDATPDFKNVYPDGSEVDMPTIYNIPLCFQRGDGSFISLPLKKGNKVLLIFSDRSIEKWQTSGAQNNPQDPRAHHLSDAFAIPCGYPLSNVASINNDQDIIIKNEGGGVVEVRVKKNNHLQIINKTDELIKVLSDLVQTIRDSVVYTSTGVQKLRHKDFSKNHNRLKTFLEK